jgi:hypothetical protein
MHKNKNFRIKAQEISRLIAKDISYIDYVDYRPSMVLNMSFIISVMTIILENSHQLNKREIILDIFI